jgi:hypothetical protein
MKKDKNHLYLDKKDKILSLNNYLPKPKTCLKLLLKVDKTKEKTGNVTRNGTKMLTAL